MENIDVDPLRVGGKPTMRGTRFTVAQLIAEIADDPAAAAGFCRDFDLYSPELVAGALRDAAMYFDREFDPVTLLPLAPRAGVNPEIPGDGDEVVASWSARNQLGK